MFFRIPVTQSGAEQSLKALIFHGQASMHAQTRTESLGPMETQPGNWACQD